MTAAGETSCSGSRRKSFARSHDRGRNRVHGMRGEIVREGNTLQIERGETHDSSGGWGQEQKSSMSYTWNFARVARAGNPNML
jgi:hypothetical protein